MSNRCQDCINARPIMHGESIFAWCCVRGGEDPVAFETEPFQKACGAFERIPDSFVRGLPPCGSCRYFFSVDGSGFCDECTEEKVVVLGGVVCGKRTHFIRVDRDGSACRRFERATAEEMLQKGVAD